MDVIRRAFAYFFLLVVALQARAMAQGVDLGSCAIEKQRVRCLDGAKRTIWMSPADYARAIEAAQSANAGTSGAQGLPDLVAILNTVIAADSRSWFFNRYDHGSVNNVRVTERSPDGASINVYADYTFNGGRAGYVEVSISQGRVECLQFWDSPRCRPIGQSHAQDLIGAALAGVASAASSTDLGPSPAGNCRRVCVPSQSTAGAPLVCETRCD